MKKVNTYYLKDAYGYIFLFLAVVSGIIVSILAIPFNIDSLYDEGYLFLRIKDAIDGTITGGSQWSNILVTFLGPKVCSSLLLLRVARLSLTLLTGVIFVLITHKVAPNIHEKILYVLMTFFLLTSSLGGIILCYNGLAQFFLITAFAALYRLLSDENKRVNVIWAILTGCMITFSIFVILPSAVLMALCIVVLVCIKYWRGYKECLMYIIGGLFGGILALLFIHFCVVDIFVVFEKMQSEAQTITTLHRGYDPISFCIKIMLFMRDWLLCICVLFGVVYLTTRLQSFSKVLAGVFYVVVILLYVKCQQKPNLTMPMLMIILWILPCVSKSKDIHWKSLLTYKNLLLLFILLFPILASIGTNVYLGQKMSFFMLPWVLGIWMVGFSKPNIIFKNETLFVLSFIVLIGTYNQYKSINYSYNSVYEGSLKRMYMNPTQEHHFAQVDSIAKAYGFKKGESVVFATQLSSMTVCYMEAKPCGNFFQPMDFVAHLNDSIPIPDFLFLCAYDEAVAGKKIREMNWDWPTGFDKYYVGSPDALNVGYPTERWLYCRKKSNTNL